MRVIQVARRFVREDWGGTETVILEFSKNLIAKGHDSEVMCSLATADTEYDNYDGVSVKRFPYFYPYLGLSAKAKKILDRKGGNFFSFPLMRALLRLKNLDIIHLHSGNRLGGIGRYVARKKKIPYVISIHGGMFDVPVNESASWTAPTKGALDWGKVLGLWVGARHVLADASAIFCVGYRESQLVKQRFPDNRVIYLPNGADTKRFSTGNGVAFREKYCVPQDAKVILTLARIDGQKNQHMPVRLLDQFLVIEPNTHLLIVGNVTNEAYYKELLSLIDSKQLQQHVTIVPGISSQSQELVDAYHAANIFLLPSYHEPFGIVILEAWAAGLPVLASHVGGIPFFVDNGVDGLLFDPRNDQSLLDVFKKLSSDEQFAQKVAQDGRSKAISEYDWSVITEKLLSVYEAVINENSLRK